MILQLSVDQLKIGLHIHDLDCCWPRHPFPRNSFPVTSQEQILRIKEAGIQEVFVDTEKSRDEEEIDSSSSSKETSNFGHQPPPSNSIPLQEELNRAAEIKQEAIETMNYLMEAAGQGKPIELNRVEPVVDGMVSSVIRNSDALFGLSRIRKLNTYTIEHSIGVSVLLLTFGKYLALAEDELRGLGIGGLFIDIGKALVPQTVLNKPGRLSEPEFQLMQRHVEFGEKIARETVGMPDIALYVVEEHHKRFDGSGYPNTENNQMTLYGQMAAITDVYDALTSDRVYCEAISQSAALKKLMDWGKQKFNQDLVQRFVHCIGIYPIGSLVTLSTGQFAVVTEPSRRGLLQPKIRVIFDSMKRQFIAPKDIDLSSQDGSEKLTIVSTADPRKWRISPLDFIDRPLV